MRYPAEGRDDVVHPHVSDSKLCAGDAAESIDRALTEGRLCDFFLLVRSVLQTYNGRSAYVRLEDWSGTACNECGLMMSDDESCYCEHCQHDNCESFTGSCEVCDGTWCRSCLCTCSECQHTVCPSCLKPCEACGTEVCTECLSKEMKIPTRPRRLSWPAEPAPVLRFTPTAWAKLLYVCHRGPTEIGGFGIADANDLLLVREFVPVLQETSVAHVRFDDGAVADYFDQQVDLGLRPEQCMRIWLHTHPGASPHPSSTDEETFDRAWGACDWAIMFILAREGATYARLRFCASPGAQIELGVEIDCTQPFEATDWPAWEAEYQSSVFPAPARTQPTPISKPILEPTVDPWIEYQQQMPEAERWAALNELGLLPDLDAMLDQQLQAEMG